MYIPVPLRAKYQSLDFSSVHASHHLTFPPNLSAYLYYSSLNITDDWMNSLSYYMSETKTNWYDARSRCKQLGGDLFYLMKKWESFQEIVDKLKPSSKNTLFVGLINRIWQWEGKIILCKLN